MFAATYFGWHFPELNSLMIGGDGKRDLLCCNVIRIEVLLRVPPNEGRLTGALAAEHHDLVRPLWFHFTLKEFFPLAFLC